MTAVLRRPNADLALEVEAPALLRVRREDITFTTLPDGHVAVSIRIANLSPGRSRPQVAILQAAPLGAFVPWRPLTTVRVPALEPGETFVVEAEAQRPRPAVLADASRVPPQGLLTALASDDRERAQTEKPRLPVDLMDLLGRGAAHWAGNLNIFVGGRAVERHLAQALRVYPGRVNLAMFVVGSGRDAYTFDLCGSAVEWQAAVYALTNSVSLTDLQGATAVPQGQWVEVSRQSLMMLALQPPRRCSAGTVEVHVEQRSTGQQAIVEFSLDPNAAGPGCYTL